MPFFGSLGGSQLSKGTGGYHPGVGPQDTSGSSAAGSIGTTTMNGAANAPTATTVTGQRVAYDPYNAGSLRYSISSGSLPPGFSLNTSTGVVTGSYTAAGINTNGTVYTFTVRATDATGLNFSDRTYTVTLSVPFLYKQIITRNYMVGGYQNGSLWSNANRTLHSNDTSTNLGDGCIDNYHYKSGGCGDTYGWIFNGNSTTRFNMRTESKQNGTGAPGYGCANTFTLIDQDRTKSYTTGEGVGTIFRFTFSNETFANLGGGFNDHAAGCYGEQIGVFWSNGGSRARVTWATDTVSGANGNYGAYGQQKGLSGKIGYGYGGAQGNYNGGYTFVKMNLTTSSDSDTGARPGKILSNSGEENYGTGQLYGYCIGTYDGNGQVNRSGKFTYSTDTPQEINGALSPGGHGGASSGHCFHRD